MGIAAHTPDRYVIKLPTQVEVAVKKENFRVYQGGAAVFNTVSQPQQRPKSSRQSHSIQSNATGKRDAESKTAKPHSARGSEQKPAPKIHGSSRQKHGSDSPQKGNKAGKGSDNRKRNKKTSSGPATATPARPKEPEKEHMVHPIPVTPHNTVLTPSKSHTVEENRGTGTVLPATGSTSSSDLLDFLQQERKSLKVSPQAFFDYLSSQDIESLEDLSDAVQMPDIVEGMLGQGFKRFKLDAFTKTVERVAGGTAPSPVSSMRMPSPAKSDFIPVVQNGLDGASTSAVPPDELLCPISFRVFHDPVLAADGHTYERSSIELWLGKSRLSPMTGEELPHLELTPNVTIRKLALEYVLGGRK